MKTILVTGATDGIGLETAEKLLAKGHRVLLHGRNPDKLEAVRASLCERFDADRIESFEADLSSLPAVEALADAVAAKHASLDVLINNAGVFKTPNPVLENGQDVRFVVNTLAPALLTERLLPLLGASARVVNLSSAAQAPVDLNALAGTGRLADNAAYAQSKLALTMWTMDQAERLGPDGPMVVAVNPGSLLATKMVRDAYGMSGKDVGIGSDILVRAALSDEFADASGKYFDNDSGAFAPPHPDALDTAKRGKVVQVIRDLLPA